MTVSINGTTGEISLAVPAGVVVFYASSTLPGGFLKANGAAVSRTTYSALYAAIGTTFGTGDGSTTFNLPDMRGYFPRGWADDGSVDSGRAFGSTQQDAFESHTHTVTLYYSDGATNNYVRGTQAANGQGTRATSATGSTETRPVNVALLACIKY